MVKLALLFILYFTTYMVVTPGTEGLEFSVIANDDAEDHLVDRAQAFRSFIVSLRELLSGPDPQRVQDIRVLRAAATLTNRQRFLPVELVNYAEDRVTIIIDVLNVYVVGFIAYNVRRHFEDCPLQTDYLALFPGSLPLSYPGGYINLEARSSLRPQLDLGLQPLDVAITQLQYERRSDSPYARQLLVIIQMISEAARFSTLEERIADAIQGGSNYRLQPELLVAQNNWARLSRDIQGSTDRGVFTNAFEARMGGEIIFRALSLRELGLHIVLGLLLYNSRNQGGRGCGLQNIGDSKLRCLSQVSGQIAGFNGRCLETTDNLGVPNLRLSHCKDQEPKQEWAFQTDGTIVWEAKYCLGIKTADPPEVMLMECHMPGVAQWMLSIEGMMVERRTNLLLTVHNLESLVLFKDQQRPSQFWAFGESINPPTMLKIVGFGTGRCLEYEQLSYKVSMAPCIDTDTQLWYYYPDNTLRPVPHLCFTVEINQQLSPVISPCNGFGYNVWFFNWNGTISSANFFASVLQANADLSISLGRPTSKWNQQWIVDSYLFVGLRGNNV